MGCLAFFETKLGGLVYFASRCDRTKISGAFITASAGAAGFYEGTMDGIKSSWNVFNNSCDTPNQVTKVDNTKSEVVEDQELQQKKSWTERFSKAKKTEVATKQDLKPNESKWAAIVRQESGDTHETDSEQSWAKTVDPDRDDNQPEWVKTGTAKLEDEVVKMNAEIMKKGAESSKTSWRAWWKKEGQEVSDTKAPRSQ
jgi:hypothetical protein